jgi:hypothetical protein
MLTQSQIAIALVLCAVKNANRAKAVLVMIVSKGLQLNQVCCHRMICALLRKGREKDALYALDYLISSSSNLGFGTSSHNSNSSSGSSSSRSNGSSSDSIEQSVSSSSAASNESKSSDTDISNCSSNSNGSSDSSSSGGTSLSDMCSACILAAAAVSRLVITLHQLLSVYMRLQIVLFILPRIVQILYTFKHVRSVCYSEAS